MDLIVFGLSRCVLLDPISDDMRAWTGTGISVINIEKKEFVITYTLDLNRPLQSYQLIASCIRDI